MVRLNLIKLRSRYAEISRAALARGTVPWFHPERIEKQGILTLLIEAKEFARGRLLDVGCAEKPYKIVFEDVISEYFGVDLAGRDQSKADTCGSALQLPFQTESFDTVLCTQVLEHLPDPGAAVTEIYRVLKNEGHMILTAPMVWEVHAAPFDYFRFTPFGLETLAHRAGFKVKYIKATSGAWAVIGQRLSCMIYQLRGKPKMFIDLGIKLFLCSLVQGIFFLLDKIAHNEKESLGHIIVAVK